MNFYEAVVKFKQLKSKEDNDQRRLFAPADEKNPKNYIRDAFESVNRSFGVRCDAEEAFSIFFWNADKGKQKEFGNGRYARNLLEQAMMAQSRRITKEYKGKKVTRKALTTLKVEDFEVNASKQLQKVTKYIIGFAV